MTIEAITVMTATSPNPDWDESIWSGIHERHLAETGMENTFERFSIYAVCSVLTKYPLITGGAIIESQGDILWMDALWVAPMFRKGGIGFRILDKTTELGINLNCRAIQLNTYFKQNIPFFKHNGFQEVVCIPQWKYNLDCYFMRKSISDKAQDMLL